MLLCAGLVSWAQEAPGSKVKVSGTVVDKDTKQPLEYATVTINSTTNPKGIYGGMTESNGGFSFDVPTGSYTIKIDFISFKSQEYPAREITANTNLGTIPLGIDAQQLDAVEVTAEKSTVEFKLDKKIYNVGQDMMVKGGTVSDVLDNVPSVTVDAEGNVSLRGNGSVKILIDGKPSGMIGINVADALRMLPADSVDKVEIITNPSARYDAEGGGGIINIILKKGKAQGLNGTITASTGNPETYGITGNINYRSKHFNLFTTQGYNYRENPGNSMTNTEYLMNTNPNERFLEERRKNERQSQGYNGTIGAELFLDKTTSWTNTLSYRKSDGSNPDNVNMNYFDANRNNTRYVNRFNDQNNDSKNLEYSTNFIKKFKKDGHQLSVDASFSRNDDHDDSTISTTDNDYVAATTTLGSQRTGNAQTQNRNLIQADYVLPIGEQSRFEAGYRGNFSKLTTDYSVEALQDGIWVNDPLYTNTLEYKEKVNALYTQFGSKVNKFSYLLGLRWEDSNIDINQLTTNAFKNKKYNNFFPSAFVSYELNDSSNLTLSYSKRISRPRSRSINPFSNISSTANQFIGNPDLNPSYTNSFDLGYMMKWDQVTLNSSMYFNHTKDAEQYVRTQETISGNPVLVTKPVNVGYEDRFGFEFNVGYNPYKWWKLNSNFNFYRNETRGDYSYTNLENETFTQNFNNTAYSWFTRVSSKVTLPYKIDWQTNATYNGAEKNAQGRSKGIISANMALSKDVLKDKATIALNASDLFNSRKRKMETNLPTQNSYSEMQWRQRQITLSFTYRFNKPKTEREKQTRKETDSNGGDDYMGG